MCSTIICCRLSCTSNRIVIMSIHQPRYSIFKLFDTLTLLSVGNMVYHGPAGQALAYFSRLGTCMIPFVSLKHYICNSCLHWTIEHELLLWLREVRVINLLHVQGLSVKSMTIQLTSFWMWSCSLRMKRAPALVGW